MEEIVKALSAKGTGAFKINYEVPNILTWRTLEHRYNYVKWVNPELLEISGDGYTTDIAGEVLGKDYVVIPELSDDGQTCYAHVYKRTDLKVVENVKEIYTKAAEEANLKFEIEEGVYKFDRENTRWKAFSINPGHELENRGEIQGFLVLLSEMGYYLDINTGILWEKA